MTEPRKPQQIVDECLALADTFYVMHGMISRPGFKYFESPHPMEQAMWNLAVAAYDHIEGTEVEQCLAEIEEEGA